VNGLILSIGVIVGLVCIYTLLAVIRMRKWRRGFMDETRLDALRKLEQEQWPGLLVQTDGPRHSVHRR
jgi:hypothetical protein